MEIAVFIVVPSFPNLSAGNDVDKYNYSYTFRQGANQFNARIRVQAENDRLHHEVSLLQEELRIKDARMERLSAQRRPHYPPIERLAIFELRAARGWFLALTARRLLVTPLTVATWTNRLDDEGPDALVQVREPTWERQIHAWRRQVRYPRSVRSEVTAMIAPFPPAQLPEVTERFRAEHQLFYETLESLHGLVERLNDTSMAGMSRVRFVTLFHFVKALKSAQALGCLFFNGYGEDVEVLLRVLVEQAIIVRWIHESESDDRARAYALYLSEKQFARLQFVRKFMPSADLTRVPIAEIETAHAEYGALDKKLKWRKMTTDIEGLAATVGMDRSYLVHFYGSDFVHSNPTIEPSYVRSADGATWFNTFASMPSNALSPVVALHHLLVIADVFDDVFDLEASELLRGLMDRVTLAADPPPDPNGGGEPR